MHLFTGFLILEITIYQSLAHSGKTKYQIKEFQKIAGCRYQKPVVNGLIKHILSYQMSFWIGLANNDKNIHKGVSRNFKKETESVGQIGCYLEAHNLQLSTYSNLTIE